MNKINIGIVIFLQLLLALSANSGDEKTTGNPVDYVNPLIGTRTPAHTFPGPMLPFGMVQLSPDTRNDYTSWAACAGYDYDDSSIVGFSHTHLSGTGVPDLGDFLFMPIVGEVKTEAGTLKDPDSGYRSRYSHEKEEAAPGYYSVVLEDYNVKAELTATERVGFHKYTYPDTDDASVLIDLTHRDPVRESEIQIISNKEIAGYRRSKCWAGDQYQYFYAEFSQPFESYTVHYNDRASNEEKAFSGEKIIAVLNFDVTPDKPVLIKVGISAVSSEGAKKNLDAELDHWDFEEVKTAARDEWSKALNKIRVETKSEKDKTIFYTALYHSLLTPNIYNDVDGQYRGMDGKVHLAEGFTNYTVFSFWDTFRALHPLLTIIEPERTRDMIVSLLHKYEQFGELPMWELHSNDTRCMIGYHAVSMIADAFIKGINDVEAEKVLEAMVASAKVNKRGIDQYRELGFVPTNKSSQSVSKTLEYAYDDWCIAQMAKAIGNTEVYNEFSKRARFFENLFDKETQFMRPRYSDRTWLKEFDPMSVGKTYNFNFTEGNSYQYSLFVPQDIAKIKEMVGGDVQFDKWLDNLFSTKMDEDLSEGSDVSGLFGQYSHGNEPSHHMAYLYNYAGKPWKTQSIVRKILGELYGDDVAGICGNDDCGQMSAWYVMSALGFYSVCPGRPEYVIGSPLFDKVTLNLDNGNQFIINTLKNSDENKYISSVTLNGAQYSNTYLEHHTLMEGGNIVFNMSDTPNKEWGVKEEYRPKSDTQEIVSIPYDNTDHREFLTTKKVELKCDTEGSEIYYTTDLSTPTKSSQKYSEPISISESIVVKAVAYKDGMIPSYTVNLRYDKVESISGLSESDVSQGIAYKYYEGIFRSVYDYAREEPAETGVADAFNLSPLQRNEWIGISFDGYIEVPSDGLYSFELEANDGGQLKIDGKELFESDGRKSFAFSQQSEIYLTKGFHEINIGYFQCSDRLYLKASWKGPGFEKEEIPTSVLFHKN